MLYREIAIPNAVNENGLKWVKYSAKLLYYLIHSAVKGKTTPCQYSSMSTKAEESNKAEKMKKQASSSLKVT